MPASARSLRLMHQPACARLRLLAFPYAGGSTASFTRWSAQLGDVVELHAVVLPAREHRRRERVPEHVTELLAPLRTELGALAPMPLALFGHSMGAIVAHELAQQLAVAGRPPVLLIASGSEAPHVSGAGELSVLDDDALVRIADERWDGFPAALRDAGPLRASILALLRADLALLATCARQHPCALPCPVHVFGGDRDPRLTPAHLQAWSHHAMSPVEVTMFCGGHLFVDTNADAVACKAAELARASALRDTNMQPAGNSYRGRRV